MKNYRNTRHALGLILGIVLTLLSAQTYAVERKVFYHNNLLGSPVAATDENGNLCWREDYRPYGEKLRNEDQGCGLDNNVTGFTGHVHDRDIGLTYMQARYYDPIVGRFMGIDPVGFEESNPMLFNRYTYGFNNPYSYVDPDGKLAWIGGLVALGFEVGLQVLGNVFGTQEGYELSDMAVAFGAGFLGTYAIQAIAKADKIVGAAKPLTEIVTETAISAGSDAIKGEDVSIKGAVVDALVGKAAGDWLGDRARDKALKTHEYKQLDRQYDRATRIANSDKVGRPERRQKQAKDARDRRDGYVDRAEAGGGVVGGGAGSAALDAAESWAGGDEAGP